MNPLSITVAAAVGLAACDKPSPSAAPPVEATLTVAADRSLKDIEIGTSEIALKLTVTPTFHTPVCIEAFIGASDSRLVVYRFSGKGGYGRGNVELVFRRPLDSYDLEFFRNIYPLKYDFWSEVSDEPFDRKNIGTDGDWFELEVKDATRFHSIRRWSPDYRMEGRNLKLFHDLCEWLLSLGGVRPYDPFDPPE